MPVERPVSGSGLSVVDARIPCMATVFDDLTSHPVAAAVAAAETDLDQVAGFGFASMTRTEITDTLAALHRLQAKVAALELGILPTAETHEVGTEAVLPTPAPGGPPPPGRRNGTRSDGSSSPGCSTAITSRSGTRWPQGWSPRNKPLSSSEVSRRSRSSTALMLRPT
jgi:hypothetical protein